MGHQFFMTIATCKLTHTIYIYLGNIDICSIFRIEKNECCIYKFCGCKVPDRLLRGAILSCSHPSSDHSMLKKIGKLDFSEQVGSKTKLSGNCEVAISTGNMYYLQPSI